MRKNKEIFEPRDETHKIDTFDSNGKPIKIDLLLTMDASGAFYISGDVKLGSPISFVNYWGSNYEHYTVLDIKSSKKKQVLFGKKGYIQFKSDATSNEYLGQQITYSTLEPKNS